jgi:hypothetical protein
MKRPIRQAGRVTAEAARKITGISTPLGGVQWSDPGPSQRELVRRFIVTLEDRRVLYNPMWLEATSQVDSSIHQIRAACTETLQQLGERDFGVVPVRAIREAYRRFHDDANLHFRFFDHDDRYHHDATPGFFMALGAFRATVGQHVAALAAHYDLTIDGDLASVIPHLDQGRD